MNRSITNYLKYPLHLKRIIHINQLMDIIKNDIRIIADKLLLQNLTKTILNKLRKIKHSHILQLFSPKKRILHY